MTFLLVFDASKLNFTISKNFLFFLVLKIFYKKINSTPCFSFTFISFIQCADPISKNFFLKFDLLIFNFLLKEGKYAPSRPRLIARFILFDKKNFLPSFLQVFLMFKIIFLL